MAKDEEGCNGWSNRETWAVAHFVGQDEEIYLYFEEMTQECYMEFEDDRVTPEERKGIAAYELAGRAEEWISTNCNLDHWRDLGAEMPGWAEMMRSEIGSIWRVNWEEFAESLIESRYGTTPTN